MNRRAIAYDPYLPGRSVEHVSGTAKLRDGGHADWAVVVKRTDGPGLRAARRELNSYRIGLADPAPDIGLRAPALLAWDEGPEHVELWLEPLADELGGVWRASRFGIAAAHIASWDARMQTFPLPPTFDSEDAWAERHGQPHRVHEGVAEVEAFRSVPGASELMALLDDEGFRRTEALITSTPARIERLAAYPQTLLHHDLVRSNLFAIGEASTAAIDWENVGRGPFGVDLTPLVIGSVRRGEASANDMVEIERVVIDAYVHALAEAGIDAEADVREAYRLAVGLRWHVVLGAIRNWLDATASRVRGSRPDESRAESLRHLVPLARHILDTAERASA
ncbi:MAG: phosphotransferase [Chloroflexota bacterium]